MSNNTSNQTVEATDTVKELLRLKNGQPPLKPEHIPQELKNLAQWILWRYEIVNGKVSKPPKWLDGELVSNSKSTDSRTWKTFEQAQYDIEKANKKMTPEYKIDGVGFVFAESNGYVGIDLDDSVNTNGSIKQWALEIVLSMPQTYWEFSPSGTGLKGLIKAVKKTDKCSKKYMDGKIELFSKERYFTITTNRLPDATNFIGEYQQELDTLIDKVWADPKPTPNDPRDSAVKDIFNHASVCDKPISPVDVKPMAEGSGWDMVKTLKLTDEKLIEIAGKAKNGDKFKALWNGDISGYTGKGGEPDHSSADLALMNHLAFWTGRDSNRMVSMFMSSKLYRPGEKGDDYLDRTAAAACRGCRKTFDGSMNPPSSANEFTSTNEIEGVPDCYQCSDVGNFRRLSFYYGDDLRYIENYGWLVWNGKIWERQQLKVEALARDVVQKIHLERHACMRKPGRTEAGGDILRWARTSESQSKIESMLSSAKSEAPFLIDMKILDKDRYLLSVDNGTLNLKTSELMPHNRDNYITKISPVVYDPNATCPQFDKFMGEMFEMNQPLIDYVIDTLGYCLSGDINIQRFWVLWGSGANGKSTLINVIQHILGDYFFTASTNLMVGENKDHLTIQASLQGKRLVVCQETEAGEKFKVQLIKHLTGDPTITARFLYQDLFEFERTNKLILLTNNVPKLSDNGASMSRRLKLIPCTVEIPLHRQNEGLSDILKTEASGILNRLVNGCMRALESKLKIDPKEVTAFTENYRKENDPIYNFLSDKTIKDENAWIKSETLYNSYKWYTETLGGKPVDGKTFFEGLSKQGFNSQRTNKGRGWKGLKLKPVPTPDLDAPDPDFSQTIKADVVLKQDLLPSSDMSTDRIVGEGDEDDPFRR